MKNYSMKELLKEIEELIDERTELKIMIDEAKDEYRIMGEEDGEEILKEIQEMIEYIILINSKLRKLIKITPTFS